MPINLASFIQPRNGNSYFLLEDVYLKGGYQVRANAELRDNMLTMNRKPGMLVFTQDDGKIWVLQADLTTWAELQVGGSLSAASRVLTTYQTPELQPLEQYDFVLLAKSALVLGLSVTVPCKIEVYSTAARNDSHPFTFIAAQDHLIDDGRLRLSDGSFLTGKRYSVLYNQEQPPSSQLYFRVTNGAQVAQIDIAIMHLPLE